MIAQTEIVVPRSSRQAIKSVISSYAHILEIPSSRRGAHRLFVLRLEDALSTVTKLSTSVLKTSDLAILAPHGDKRSVTIATAIHRYSHEEPFVTESKAVLRRIVFAHAHGAADQLIASVEIIDGRLLVWSCKPTLYECAIKNISALQSLSPQQLARLQISESGSRIHWPQADVDLDLATIRYHTDPVYRAAEDKNSRQRALAYAKSIRKVREKHGIKQNAVRGLSERQIRRLESGAVQPHHKTLEKLAAAHSLTVDSYLGELARHSVARRRKKN
jgi:hypothetical protein